ncbi:MAG: DUF3168 domain-containing protein [Sphingopyxis sp.]
MKIALRARLLGASPVTDIAGETGVDWGPRPQGTPYPWLGLKVISSSRPQHYKGFVGLRQTRVQLDCMALDEAEAVALREAAIAAIVPAGSYHGTKFQRGFIENVRDLGADSGADGFVHRECIDALIWHN